MAQLTWEAMNPIDTSKYLDAIQKAQAQSVAGVEQIGNAYKGYHDNLKKQNTNDMLTALNQAQNPEELAAAQSNIAAMQQRWGTGYDMDAVRTAMDERPAELNERASKALKYQQEKALHEAYPQINKAAAEFAAGRKGVTPEMAQQLDTLAALGIDTSGYINSLASSANTDFTTERTYTTGRSDRTEDLKIAKDARDQAQKNWQADYDSREDNTNWNRGKTIADANPGGNTLSFQDGKWVTTTNPGISHTDAYGALSGLRGIRNNNPGNIDFYNQRGATLESKGGRFARFSTPEQGLNAMSKQLDLYFTGKSRNVTKPINTIKDIITTWAPPKNKKGQVENNTAVYIANVAKSMGVDPTAKLNLNDPNTKAALMSAMITQENGGNPYTHEQYIAGITGKTSTAAAASNAIQIPQASAAKAVSGYNTAITELNNKFNLKTTQDQSKTAMGSKGQTIDSWRVSETTKEREGVTLFTDYASKVAKLARNNAKLSNLPMDDQIRVLDAAHAWAVTPGGVITDKGLDKRITQLATSLIDGKKNEHEQGKKNIFETQYQAFVQELNAAGMGAVSRDAFKQLVSPELALNATKVTVKTPPASQSSKPAAKASPAPTTAAATAAVASAAKPKPAVNAESTKAAETPKQDFKPKPAPRPYDNLVLKFPDQKTKAEFDKEYEQIKKSEQKAIQARKTADAAKKAQKLREDAVEKRKVADILVKRAREDAARKAEEELRRAKHQQALQARRHPAPSDEWLKSAKERLKQNR